MKKRAFDYEKLLLILLCIGFSFIFYGKTIAVENVNYGVEQLHQYNHELFQNNIGLMEDGFSPRYYANVIVSILMNLLRISWAGAATLIIRANFIIYAVAAARTIQRLSKHKLLFGVILVSCMFRSSLGTLAGFGLNGAMDVFIGTGTALVLLGISFLIGEKKNWLAAWICLSLATLMHVHEGMWGGCAIGIIWLAGVISEKKIDWKALKGMPIYVVVMLLVTVPALLHGEAVDEGLFAEIYVNIRTPNHLLPTAWGTDVIVKSFLLLLIPALFLAIRWWKDKNDVRAKQYLILSILSMALWIAVFAVQYFGTILHPSSTIITMYLPKCFKYMAYFAMLLYLKIADMLYEEERYLQGAFSILTVLLGCNYSFAVTMLCAVLLLAESLFGLESRFAAGELPYYKETVKLLTWEIFLAALGVLHGWNEVVVMAAAVVFVAEFILPYLKNQNVYHVILCLFAVFVIGYSVEGTIYKIDEYTHKVSYVSGEECLRSAMGNDIYTLSTAFREASEAGDEFLADPYDGDSGWVQLISERNCYCIFKSTPSSKRAVIDWYERIKQVENMSQMTAEELAALMQEIGTDYVMAAPEQYDVLDRSDAFEEIVKTKTAGMYRLSVGEAER